MARTGLVAGVIALVLLLLVYWIASMGAGRQMKKTYSANNMGQFGRAMHIYLQRNAGQWPDSLEQMLAEVILAPRDRWDDMLTNPQRPNMKPAYVYLKPAVPVNQIDNPGRIIFMYEAHDEWGPGINVGFLDGHVEFTADRVEFEDLLAKSRTPNLSAKGWEWFYTSARTTQPAETTETGGQ